MTNTMMQQFWDSALSPDPPDDEADKEKLEDPYYEGDNVLLAADNELVGAVNHARFAGWKVPVQS